MTNSNCLFQIFWMLQVIKFWFPDFLPLASAHETEARPTQQARGQDGFFSDSRSVAIKPETWAYTPHMAKVSKKTRFKFYSLYAPSVCMGTNGNSQNKKKRTNMSKHMFVLNAQNYLNQTSASAVPSTEQIVLIRSTPPEYLEKAI